jgi:2-phosphoglycerate kinase
MRPESVDTVGDALLILGVAGVGKSTIGRHCALRWPAKRYVDVGTVREVLRSKSPDLRHSTYAVWRLAGDAYSPATLSQGFERYAELMWPAVVRILENTAREANNLVVDGAMLSPRLVAGLRLDNLRLHARMLCLSDSDDHFRRMRGSVRTGSPQEERLVESFPRVRALQEYLEDKCRAQKIPIIENVSLEDTLRQILASLPRTSD